MSHHPQNRLVHTPYSKLPHWVVPLNARAVNALFGFEHKVPADFLGVVVYNGHKIWCLKSSPPGHRMMTNCPICDKWLTVGCLPQHMRTMH